MEKLIREILRKESSKTLEFEIDEDGKVKGDLKSLKNILSDHSINVRDFGIGAYEYWGQKGVDKQLGADFEGECVDISIKDSSESDIDDLISSLADEAGIKMTLKFKDEDEIDEDEDGRPRRTYRGTGVEAEYELKAKNHKEKDGVHTCTLCYEEV
jgi:hypothetical protein